MIHIVIWYFLNIGTLKISFLYRKNIDTLAADPMGQLKTAIQLGRELFFMDAIRFDEIWSGVPLWYEVSTWYEVYHIPDMIWFSIICAKPQMNLSGVPHLSVHYQKSYSLGATCWLQDPYIPDHTQIVIRPKHFPVPTCPDIFRRADTRRADTSNLSRRKSIDRRIYSMRSSIH